jgi:3-oxo-5alpha-steroid 4-dehydrogenase
MVTPERSVIALPAREVPRWDAEADVVVVGYGTAGAAASAEATARGATVVALERSSGWESAAGSLSGGLIYMGGGTPLQKACGFEDTPEEMFKFLMAAMGPGADEAKTAVYCEESVDHFEWLVACGVPFKASFWEEPAWEIPGDDGLMYSGGENAHPFDQIARPAPRAHVPQMPDKRYGVRGGGYKLLQALASTAEQAGADIRYDTSVDRMVVEADGRVVGVVARQYGEERHVRARGGVVLATGSFVYNDDMVLDHAPWMAGRPGSAIEAHDGRSVRMAQALGAGVKHMDACEVAFGVDPGLLARGLLVNGAGQRFMNEDTYAGRLAHAVLVHQANQAFLVVDEAGYEDAPVPERLPFLKRRLKWAAPTLAELEEDMGLVAGALEATVGLYNRHAAAGVDPLFHKAGRWVRPLQPPFGAIDLRNETQGFTLGGLTTTPRAEVLHVDRTPIPGLYAAGRATSGIPAWGYASGTSLGDGTFFGRRAGRNAAIAAVGAA